MSENYNRRMHVSMTEWTDESTPENPDEHRDCLLEECYFDSHSGDLVIRFYDRDTDRSFDLSIPVKPIEKWNKFVESLPQWDL